MQLKFTEEQQAFRREARDWLESNLTGAFAELRGRGGPGDADAAFDGRLAWERHMAAAGWTCIGWPVAHGGRGASLQEQVIFNEEYARARAPGRLGHIGETLLGPTLIAFGTDEQKARFLPAIARSEQLWCQGYSEPNAGSDLANVQTRAVRDGGEWVITGQKIWTSHADWADWCFALCRTNPNAPKHRGLSYLLVPMKQDGVEIRPIEQMTGGSEFSEVFFDGARTAAGNVVGEIDGGWKVAMGTLAFERGASTLGQQLSFQNELDTIVAIANRNGAAADPVMRQRLAAAWTGLRVMRFNALRMLSRPERAELGREGMITKLYWATWHRELGKLAMDVLGAESEIADGGPHEYALTSLQRAFLFARADTIYAGSNQIQRNLIGERALGLPREPRS
jgi:alkylation response protein AidB-like acyl-CoA dehydrogenase